MQVRMIMSRFTADGVLAAANSTVDVSDQQAQEWIGSGVAVAVTPWPTTDFDPDWLPPQTRAGQALVSDAGNLVGLRRLDGIAPIGANSYDLIRRKMIQPDYDQAKILDWVQSAGGNLVRCMWPAAFGASDYTTYVFSAGVPPAGREMNDGDFRADFLSISDTTFSLAAARGIRLLACICFSGQGASDLFGETPATGWRVGSQTHNFMARLVRYFARRYGTNPGLGAVSFINEPQWFELSGAGWPTAAELGGLFASLAQELRTIAPSPVVTSDLVFLPQDTSAARPTYDSAFPQFRLLTAGLDAVGLHVYTKGPSQSGYTFSGATSVVTPAVANNLGFEGFGSLACAARSLCDSVGKPLIWTETGVANDVEADTERVKKDRNLTDLLRYGQVALLWDVADVASPQANQVVWQIRPGTTRGNTYLAVAQDYNTGRASRLAPVVKGAGTRALRRALLPKMFFSSTRSAGATVSCASTAAMTSATQAVAFWVRRDAALTNFEAFIDCRGAGNLSGFVALEGSTAGSTPLFVEWRGAAGGAGNTSGILPISALGEWVHIAAVRRTIAGTAYTELWWNGMYWNTVATTSTYVGIPSGTTLRFCGGATNGAPVSLQDVCIAPYLTPEDIWALMRGEIVPQAVLHVRAMYDTIVDVSRGATALTIGSGITVTG